MLAKYLLRGKYFSPKGLRLHIKPSERGFIVYFRIGFGETWLLQTRNRYLTTSASGRKDAMLQDYVGSRTRETCCNLLRETCWAETGLLVLGKLRSASASVATTFRF